MPAQPPGHALAGWEVGDLDSVALSVPGACTPGPIVKTPPRGEGQDFPPARPRDPHAPSAPLHKGTSRDHACMHSGLPPASRWVRGACRPQGSSGRCGVQTDPAAGVGSPLTRGGPLGETVYLPTCHVFAKTAMLKDVSASSVSARWGTPRAPAASSPEPETPPHGDAFRSGLSLGAS